ncbi:MAG TPA: DUF2336 domain-containing protein [Caulobacterales bacterium]|jgi:uncharacterized protein (DUF2336 family)|nr:DUF2336 domain-containing protein [Caulobacterales bacterium]
MEEPIASIGKTEAEEAALLRARAQIAGRLAEIVAWPATRIAPHERQLAGDILIGLLRTAGLDLRKQCAERMAQIVDAPKVVLRYLARDEIDIALPLLDQSPALDDADLIATIRASTPAHWAAIAQRRNISETVTDALIHTNDVNSIALLLRNAFSRLSAPGVDSIVAMSRQSRELVNLLLTREEVKPAQGLTLFWWADAEARVRILRRFAVDRSVLLQEVSDIFVQAAHENWTDVPARQALQFIERRQRNRAAAQRSEYQSLENAVLAIEQKGVTREIILEIATLCGVKPVAGARILGDAGGEPIAVLAKAVGLKRDFLLALWKGLKRPMETDPKSSLSRTLYVFDTLSNAKAQTVLRYWNWSLTSDAPAGVGQMDPTGDSMEFAPARRTASLVLGWRP